MKSNIITSAIRTTRQFTVKHAPEILMGVGVVGTVASTVLACKATLKATEIFKEREEMMDQVLELEASVMAGETAEETYSLEDAKKDKLQINAATVGRLIKFYGPSITLMVFSIGCMLGANRILHKRNVALMAAYKVLEETFAKYRKRVVKKLGKEQDAHFYYGTETEEVEETVVDENGKKKKVKKEVVKGVNLSGFARMFEQDKPDNFGSWDGSTQWSKVHDYNLTFLQAKEAYFNDLLVSKGFVTINEVYSELGFASTQAGMVCGWKYKSSNGDGYISFRPRSIDGNWMMGKDGDSIVLDFNIDGVIFDENAAASEVQ